MDRYDVEEGPSDHSLFPLRIYTVNILHPTPQNFERHHITIIWYFSRMLHNPLTAVGIDKLRPVLMLPDVGKGSTMKIRAPPWWSL